MDSTFTALGRLLHPGYLFGGETADAWRPPRRERRGVGAATTGSLGGASGACARERWSRPGRQDRCAAKRQSGARSSGAVPHARDVIRSHQPMGKARGQGRNPCAAARSCTGMIDPSTGGENLHRGGRLGEVGEAAMVQSRHLATRGTRADKSPERIVQSGCDAAVGPGQRGRAGLGRTMPIAIRVCSIGWSTTMRSSGRPRRGARESSPLGTARVRTPRAAPSRHPSGNRVLQDSVRSDVASPGLGRRGSGQRRAFAKGNMVA